MKDGKNKGIKSAILRWLGVPVELTNGAFIQAFNDGGLSNTGKVITADKALTVSTVWACVNLIAESIASLPVSMYRRDGQARVEAVDHPLVSLLKYKPNALQTPFEFWQCVMSSLLLWGNSFVEIIKNSTGTVIALDFLYPARMGFSVDPDSQLPHYMYMDLDGKTREIPLSRMWHLRGMSLDGYLGLSAIRYGANVLGNALAGNEAADEFFKNGLMARYVFTVDKPLKPSQRQEFREHLKQISGSMNAGKTPVLEAGMDVKNVNIDPIDAQLLESRAFSVEEVCRWFRVPPHMIGHTSKITSWGAGIESQKIGFLTFTLLPWLKRIQQSIGTHLLGPVERQRYFARFNIDGFQSGDSRARALYYATALQNGWLNRNEVRALEERDAIPGGDEYTVQSNMTPVEMLRLLVESTNQNPPTDNSGTDDEDDAV